MSPVTFAPSPSAHVADPFATALADRCEPPPDQRREWSTPGELAASVDPATVQTPALDLIDDAVVWAHTTPGARMIISMPPQEGKGLALATPIATPSGWTAMGDLRVGDVVFGGDGKPCCVTAAYEPRLLDCWRVTFANGSELVADGDHLWLVQDRNGATRGSRMNGGKQTRPWVVENTRKIAANPVRYGVPLPGAIELPDRDDLPLDPYVFGAWLGDGHTASPMMTIAEPEIVGYITDAGIPCRKMASGKYAWSLAPEGWRGVRGNPSPVKAALRELGVLGDKHIPVPYLRSGKSQRIALLQGLMDTDGSVYPNESGYSRCEFTTTCRRLADDVLALTRSLGIHSKVHESRATLNGRDISARWRIRFTTALPVFRLTRKLARLNGSPGERKIRNRNGVASAEPVDSVPTRCIEVDSIDRTFLAGYGLIPTHNSERVTKAGTLWALTRNPELRAGIVSYSQGLAETFGRAVRNWITSFNGDEGTLDLGLRIARDNGSVRRWQLDGHRGGCISAGIGSGLTGRPLDFLVIDDPLADRKQANSEFFRARVWDWWTSVGSTRLAPDAPVIVILTRWHEDDLAGRLLKAEDGHRWRVINIPALADHKPEAGQRDLLGREPGEWLQSARKRTPVQWEQIRIQAGSRDFTSLYQGRPSPDQGDVWQRQWWRRYHEPLWSQHPEVPSAYLVSGADEVLISVDAAFKDTKSSDYVVMQCWMRRGANAYLLEQVRKRLSFTETVKAFTAMCARWPQARRKLIEDKANGTAVISSLKSEIPGLKPINPTDSKYGRATAVSPMIESGNVFLPSAEVALFDAEELITEAASFPNAAHDDQVDATSQALAEMFLDGNGAMAWQRWAEQKALEAQQASGAAVSGGAPAPGPEEADAADEPDAVVVPIDPVAARKAARDAAFRAAQQR